MTDVLQLLIALLVGVLIGTQLSDWLNRKMIQAQRDLLDEYRKILGPLDPPRPGA